MRLSMSPLRNTNLTTEGLAQQQPLTTRTDETNYVVRVDITLLHKTACAPPWQLVDADSKCTDVRKESTSHHGQL